MSWSPHMIAIGGLRFSSSRSAGLCQHVLLNPTDTNLAGKLMPPGVAWW